MLSAHLDHPSQFEDDEDMNMQALSDPARVVALAIWLDG